MTGNVLEVVAAYAVLYLVFMLSVGLVKLFLEVIKR